MNHVAEIPAAVDTETTRQAVKAWRSLSQQALERMCLPGQELFAFRIRRTPDGDRVEGVSRRYTAIVLIGLAGEDGGACRDILHGASREGLCARLIADTANMDNLGDVALTLWAARALDHRGAPAALKRLAALDPSHGCHPTVELAWALTALSIHGIRGEDEALASAIAARLLGTFGEHSHVFSHMPGGESASWLRGHVACFADQVYPIQALACYHQARRDRRALDAAVRCARRICDLQGSDGQWWWHYDHRTGRVVEGYPVYSVHQDAMAPMALFRLQDAGGGDYSHFIERGLHWLIAPSEVSSPLVDYDAELIWRKVGRHEPGKLGRASQALASRIHPRLRVPKIDCVLKPGFIDRECRPYHLGWLLYAWTPERVAGWGLQDGRGG